MGTPTVLCITPGSRQVLHVAHTADPDVMEDAVIFEVDLEGRILGKLGRPGGRLARAGDRKAS